MYNTIDEILLAVKEKFQGATELSKVYDGCFYGHEVNGVGCAIGCLYSEEDAKQLDNLGGILSWSDYAWEQWGDPMFGSKIDKQSLYLLQEAHDKSESVDEFLYILDYRIETKRWIKPDKTSEMI